MSSKGEKMRNTGGPPIRSLAAKLSMSCFFTKFTKIIVHTILGPEFRADIENDYHMS